MGCRGKGVSAYLSLSGSGREVGQTRGRVGWDAGGHLFEAGRLLTFSPFRMGAYLRWALIHDWAPIRINTVPRWWERLIQRKRRQVFERYNLPTCGQIAYINSSTVQYRWLNWRQMKMFSLLIIMLYKRNGKHCSCATIELCVHLGGLLSTQDSLAISHVHPFNKSTTIFRGLLWSLRVYYGKLWSICFLQNITLLQKTKNKTSSTAWHVTSFPWSILS